MKIHYLQHVKFEGLASIQHWLSDQGYPVSATRFYQNDPLPAQEDFDFLIIMGGPMSTNDESEFPWLVEEKLFIEKAIAKDKPILGICLGAQLIAETLGSKIFPNAQKEIGWFPVELTSEGRRSPLFNSLPEKLFPFHWHGDTFDLPDGAKHLARSEACANQAFSYGDRILGLQFHLDFTKTSAENIIKYCGDELTEARYIQTKEELMNKSSFNKINNHMSRILDNIKQLHVAGQIR